MNMNEIKTQIDNITQELAALKQRDPKKYLVFITELNQIVSDLNKELREAKAQLRA